MAVADDIVHTAAEVFAETLAHGAIARLDAHIGDGPVGEVVAVRKPCAPGEHFAAALAPHKHIFGRRRHELPLADLRSWVVHVRI